MAVQLSQDDKVWFGVVSELFREVDVLSMTENDVLRYWRMFRAHELERRRTEQLLKQRRGWHVIDGGRQGAVSTPCNGTDGRAAR